MIIKMLISLVTRLRPHIYTKRETLESRQVSILKNILLSLVNKMIREVKLFGQTVIII